GPGVRDRGVAALGRALEHASLPWAWWGWLIRLPVLTSLLQLVADACGLGPRDLSGTPEILPTASMRTVTR
ncbi:MAG: hypothetical protein ACRCZP_09155, partial [Phycicoccus sp.]